MSDWTPQQLRRWKPRQPSPRIYRQIFGHDAEAEATFDLRDLSRWFVPALGCFLLVMASLSTHLPPRYSFQMATTNFVLPSFTEENGSVELPGAVVHSDVNAVPARRLEWNFGARTANTAATSMGTLLISYTNKLIQ